MSLALSVSFSDSVCSFGVLWRRPFKVVRLSKNFCTDLREVEAVGDNVKVHFNVECGFIRDQVEGHVVVDISLHPAECVELALNCF